LSDSLWLEDDFDAAILFLLERFVKGWCFVDAHGVGDEVGDTERI